MKRSVARTLAPPTLCTSFVDPFATIYDRNRLIILALWGQVWVELILPISHVWPICDMWRAPLQLQTFAHRSCAPSAPFLIAPGLLELYGALAEKVVSAVLAIGCDRLGHIIRSGFRSRCRTFLPTEGIERNPGRGCSQERRRHTQDFHKFRAKTAHHRTSATLLTPGLVGARWNPFWVYFRLKLARGRHFK